MVLVAEPENAVVECQVDSAWGSRGAQYTAALVQGRGRAQAQGQGSLQGFRAPRAKALAAVAHGHSQPAHHWY